MVEQILGSFVSWQYDTGTWMITTCMGSQYMYLLEGEEYAMLIDTAYGLGDLRGLVEKLTDKPVITVNTHGHLDHVGGNGQWQKVYMHQNALIDQKTLEGGPCDISKLPYPDYEKCFIEEGHVFHLGGRDIEVIDITAHSNGSLAFLDASHGLLYTGDELEAAQVLLYELVPTGNYDLRQRLLAHHANMEKLLSRSREFDHICAGHNGSPIAKDYAEDFFELSTLLLEGKIALEKELHHNDIKDPDLRRARYRKASFFVRQSDLDKMNEIKFEGEME